ncbi:MAG: glycosyl hydrolase 115 family protein [Alistipes sp.]|jgi:hypothetical protein|nr:glycosyl hydrolase 115 family protein [Alistipes sp.]
MKSKFLSLSLVAVFILAGAVPPLGAQQFVSFDRPDAALTLATGGEVVPIYVDKFAEPGTKTDAFNLAADFERVTGTAAHVMIFEGRPTTASTVIIVGVLGNSPMLDRVIEGGHIDRAALEGKREKFVIKTVSQPLPGIERALVIAGSDKRGASYGVYELSEQMGVSPWYWWADVPVTRRDTVSVLPGEYTGGEPVVEYRGIFFNDEAPALTGWVNENYGGYNSRFYSRVFELLLRLKANFLWPAMWDAAFYDDDPLNSVLADQAGIVIGLTHHEPMNRSQKEWTRYGTGPWDYEKNRRTLDAFWREGVERMKHTGDFVNLGMRGDGDEAMSRDTNIALLERIVRNQRRIIEQVTGRPAAETPQLWALYKEVQEYYDQGMRVPDDVTLLLCDDNWGNVRKLPEPGARPRSGGYGMYYHFDYVGGPRNYKWLNVSQAHRIWEQMNLCYEYGVTKLWVVNVGDLKPMEYPIDFFLEMAWDPARFNAGNVYDHTVRFATQQFGAEHGAEAARLINQYTYFNHRRTPELLDSDTFSLDNYGEWERVTREYTDLAADALRLYYLIPAASRDAFDQLVLWPIQACANLYEMYYAAAMNRKLAAAADPAANRWADEVKKLYGRDSVLTHHYNRVMSGGKWNHFADQKHIGYRMWQEPRVQTMPTVTYVPEGAPGAGVFVEADGYVAIESHHYSRAVGGPAAEFTRVPWIGRTEGGMTTTPAAVTLADDPAAMYLEYEMETATVPAAGRDAELVMLWSPTLNFNGNRGLRYAVSVDGGPEQVVNINGHYRGELGRWQGEAIIRTSTRHTVTAPGRHTVRVRFLDSGLVLQRLMLDLGGLKPSYLGAPESTKN